MLFEYKIKELCLKRKISLKELSQISGVSESTIRRMASPSGSNVRINTILKLCRGLSVCLHEFLVINKM